MDPLDAVDRLAERACRDEAPAVDVADQVLARIGSLARPRRLVPLSVFSVASVLVAGVMLAVGFHFWLTASDPMNALLPAIQVVSLW